jgi:hypothetical protein
MQIDPGNNGSIPYDKFYKMMTQKVKPREKKVVEEDDAFFAAGAAKK